MSRVGTALILALLALPAEALATVEAFGLPEQVSAEHLAAVRVAAEPVPVLELGYSRPALLRIGDQALGAGVALAAPLLLIPDARDLRASTGAATTFALGGDFRLSSGVSAFWATADDTTARANALGLEAGASGRYCRGRFYVGVPLRVRSTLLLHLDHHALMKTAYDDRYDNGSTNAPQGVERIEGPRDGWYALTAWRVFGGLETGVASSRLAFHAGAGIHWAPQAQGLFFSPDTGHIPLYLETSLRLAF